MKGIVGITAQFIIMEIHMRLFQNINEVRPNIDLLFVDMFHPLFNEEIFNFIDGIIIIQICIGTLDKNKKT